MNEDKINKILNNVENQSNSTLKECELFLQKDFEDTKDIIIKLTRHLDSIEISYKIVRNELNKRLG
jgi:uncharacterized membrane protein YgaE (UPF0421/DUF939 family)